LPADFGSFVISPLDVVVKAVGRSPVSALEDFPYEARVAEEVPVAELIEFPTRGRVGVPDRPEPFSAGPAVRLEAQRKVHVINADKRLIDRRAESNMLSMYLPMYFYSL
jgi:hypothetical protein